MHVCLCMYTGTQTHARARTHSHAQVLGVRLVWCGARTTQRQPRGPAKRETKNESVPGAAGVPLVDIHSEAVPVAAGVREACLPCLRGINSGWGVGRARGAAAAGGGAREGWECTWVGAPLEIVVPDTGGWEGVFQYLLARWECFSICLLDGSVSVFACSIRVHLHARAQARAHMRVRTWIHTHMHTQVDGRFSRSLSWGSWPCRPLSSWPGRLGRACGLLCRLRVRRRPRQGVRTLTSTCGACWWSLREKGKHLEPGCGQTHKAAGHVIQKRDMGGRGEARRCRQKGSARGQRGIPTLSWGGEW